MSVLEAFQHRQKRLEEKEQQLEVERRIDYLAWGVRYLCIALSALVVVKPLAILFLVYPLVELLIKHWPEPKEHIILKEVPPLNPEEGGDVVDLNISPTEGIDNERIDLSSVK